MPPALRIAGIGGGGYLPLYRVEGVRRYKPKSLDNQIHSQVQTIQEGDFKSQKMAAENSSEFPPFPEYLKNVESVE